MGSISCPSEEANDEESSSADAAVAVDGLQPCIVVRVNAALFPAHHEATASLIHPRRCDTPPVTGL